ncbi:hypothetical protein Q73A0000_09625 [Kaistella flava (ex Peng et al. 2021)]|uniref:Uncharacterized protein n=1 Tax=Kaistella flava (ex Peng et al. 2021) TaxID=2038776 RepID=A0A7M2YB75_9FLAO|nr:hypothetical protein [Kaistella flava (ex Peng et al. 2021)]QOW10613.1 hypothetical protein Q73A0000_09625 [Kaistella flava (ex Peng et al. 2021)]
MKKSIAILSIFLLLILGTGHDQRDHHNPSKMELRLTSKKQYSPFSLSAAFSHLDDENDPDPPRQDPWQWRNALDKLMELLKYLSSNR